MIDWTLIERQYDEMIKYAAAGRPEDWETPSVINTDKVRPYAAALAELKQEGSVRRRRCIDRSNT